MLHAPLQMTGYIICEDCMFVCLGMCHLCASLVTGKIFKN